jgi:hypothetical protein
MLKVIYKKYKSVRSLIQLAIGLVRVFINFYNIIKISFVKRKIGSVRIVFIAPLHSAHFFNFKLKLLQNYDMENIKLCLINSDPNSLLQSVELNDIIIDGSIYKLFGYNVDIYNWQRDLLMHAKNKIGNLSKLYINLMINLFRPQIIWVHDLQSGGYLSEQIINDYKFKYPKTTTCASVWGNDLYFYGHLPSHSINLRLFLKNLDYLHVESNRDKQIATGLDFQGVFFPVSSVTMTEMECFRKCENNNTIIEKDIFLVVKGSYHYRSNFLSFINDVECNFVFWRFKKIYVVNASEEDVFHLSRIKYKYNLDVSWSRNTAHDDFILVLCRSRFFLTLNLSDGINNSSVYATYVNCIPLISNHTGLIDSLNAELKELLVFDFSGMVYSKRILKLLELSDAQRTDLLRELKFIFENEIFNDEIQLHIFDEVFKHAAINDDAES